MVCRCCRTISFEPPIDTTAPSISGRRTDDRDERPRVHYPVRLAALQSVASRHRSPAALFSAAA